MVLSSDERLAFEAVEEIQSMKRDNRREPDYAMIFEVYNFLRPELPAGFEPSILEALRNLYRKNLIVHHKNINGIPMFGVKE